MKKLIVAGITLAMSLGLTMSVQADGDAEKGKTLFPTCSVCHGAGGEGNATFHAPAIGGQEAWYIERQLKNFKAGLRGGDARDLYGAQMRPMAMTLVDDQAIADVAAYVSSLKPAQPEVTIKGDAAAGKAAFAVCAACHGANGEGNKALNAPKLVGQQDWYVVQQVNNFKAGIRGANPQDAFGAQMRPMAMTLPTDEAVNNMAAFIATLK